MRAMLKEYVDQGARGFGEHKAGLAIDHPKMQKAPMVNAQIRRMVRRRADIEGLPRTRAYFKFKHIA